MDQDSQPVSAQADVQAAAVIARARRLMLLTLAVTFAALVIVLIFIGYRVFSLGGSAPVVADNVLRLPAGARLLSATTGEGRLVVTIQGSAGTEILTFDANTLKQIGRLRVTSGP
jgi:hypothetical protein